MLVLPDRIHGAFFVLQWETISGAFVLTLDDADHSSFDLGESAVDVVRMLVARGFEHGFAGSCVDLAREFRAVQCIPAQARVILLFRRDPVPARLKFPDDEQRGDNAYIHL